MTIIIIIMVMIFADSSLVGQKIIILGLISSSWEVSIFKCLELFVDCFALSQRAVPSTTITNLKQTTAR